MGRKPISVAFYDKNDLQKKQYLSYMKRKIRNSNESSYNLVLKQMMEVVEKTLLNHFADFYVHDVEIMKFTEGSPVLWIVRDYGTHIVDLQSEIFHEGSWGKEIWDAERHFNAILHNVKSSGKKVRGIYLIENEKMKKISEKSAYATLAIKKEWMKHSLKEVV